MQDPAAGGVLPVLPALPAAGPRRALSADWGAVGSRQLGSAAVVAGAATPSRS